MEPTVIAVTHLPLSQAWVCVECEAIFLQGFAACPACASATMMPLAQWLQTLYPPKSPQEGMHAV